jgi:hypothetical protein
MTHLSEPTSAVDIITRIDKVKPESKPLWGKMDAAQMIAHCQAPIEAFFGEKQVKHSLMGKLFGKMARRKLFADKPWPKGLPTAKEFVVTNHRDLVAEKIKLMELIRRFNAEGKKKEPSIHPFFGMMSTEEWSQLVYKHLDHHLQQFGV